VKIVAICHLKLRNDCRTPIGGLEVDPWAPLPQERFPSPENFYLYALDIDF
jgi:hypothetical protein